MGQLRWRRRPPPAAALPTPHYLTPPAPPHPPSYLLERMVPELDDLEARGFFDADEVRAVAARRRDFEYALKRRAPLKTDFLR